MRENGNPTQWGNYWPSEEIVLEDCAPDGHGYVIVNENGDICGVFAFFVGIDETYLKIEQGSWLNDEPYGAIHRIASDGVTHGVLRMAAEWCGQFVPNLRADTHRDNMPMQKALLSNGFCRCGVIHIFPHGTETGVSAERIAFQKKVR